MTSYTRQRTYDRETWLRARDAWDRGGFGSEWADCRGLAAKAGIIFPPDGDALDSWADDSPSQRAMLIRAIRETPRLLRWAIASPGVHSWGDVLERLLRGRDDMADDADRRRREWETVKRGDRPARIGDVVRVLADSLGVER